MRKCIIVLISSVQFSHSVVSDSLWPHRLQHARPPSPSPTPGAYSNSCPLRQWCHPTISSSVFPFSSCLQSFPASGSFQMSQLFASGGQNIGVSASTSVLPMNIQDCPYTNEKKKKREKERFSNLFQRNSKQTSKWQNLDVRCHLMSDSEVYDLYTVPGSGKDVLKHPSIVNHHSVQI